MEDTISFYQLSANLINGTEKNMGDYRGKWLLIVNTASQCGFTPQLEGLESLYQKYRERGFEVLGFPCNQFGAQEPGDEAAIRNGCMLQYRISFPMFAKINVNGPATHPVYRFLKSRLGGLVSSRIKWNFTKFLVDPEGKPVKRWGPTVRPEVIDRYLQSQLIA